MKWLLFIFAYLICVHVQGQFTQHSRGAAMGDAGIAAASSNQALGYNVGKTVFSQHFHQASLTYLPWMRQFFQDTKMIRLDYLHTLNDVSTLGMAIQYLDMGNLTTRDDYGASLAIYRNTAFSIGSSIGIRLSKDAGIGTTLRVVGARDFDSGLGNRYGVSGDLQFYQSFGKISSGLTINHLGNSLLHPLELGFGLAYTDHDEVKEWTLGMDIRKILSGAFRGNRYSMGGELGFEESFFIRTGMQLESIQTGNRKLISLGVGYKGFIEDQSLSLDFHYQIPFGNQAAFAAFQHAYGFTLNLNLGNFQ